jgi:CRP/FNR family transcriptional regulator, cyclic AMP receptor protein
MPGTDGNARAQPPSLSDVFDRESLSAARMRIDAQQSIYEPADDDFAVYLIESGGVKLSMSTAAGQDCLLGIYTSGEVFGESCFSGLGKRLERASAMQPTVVRRALCHEFLAEVHRSGACGALVRHLAIRLQESQIAILDRVTMDAERRLAKVLLEFGEKFGVPDGPYIRIDQRISHEELSQFVGTTRPRITVFMQRFRRLGIVQDSPRSISVHREKALQFFSRE